MINSARPPIGQPFDSALTRKTNVRVSQRRPLRASSNTLPWRCATAALLGLVFLLASCAEHDRRHQVIVSVPDQKMLVLDQGVPVASYPVSTSKFGLGDTPGTGDTPLGALEVAKKIGGAAESGTVFKDRRPTGEIVPPDAPGRDPIVTRILWLKGLELQNQNAFGRYIYIHGTPEERNIGRPVSYGCIRMRSRDVMELYDRIGLGARVNVVDYPLEQALPQRLPGG